MKGTSDLNPHSLLPSPFLLALSDPCIFKMIFPETLGKSLTKPETLYFVQFLFLHHFPRKPEPPQDYELRIMEVSWCFVKHFYLIFTLLRVSSLQENINAT